MSTPQIPIFFDAMVVGAKGVGKTSLISQYAKKKFSLEHRPTDSNKFVNKQFLLDVVPVNLSLWDTPAQTFQTPDVSFYRKFECFVVVFDVNDRGSLEALDAWYAKYVSKICQPSAPKIPIVLIGNKVDVDGGTSTDRAVSTSTADEWCALRGNIPYFYASAKDDYNINEAFHCAAELALKYLTDPQMTDDPCRYIRKISHCLGCNFI